MALCLGAACVVAAWWHFGGAVDTSVRGRWRAVSQSPNGLTREDDIEVPRSGRARLETTIRGEGRFEAADGAWRLVTTSGDRFHGTYAQPAPAEVTLRGFPFGGESWRRHGLPDGGGPLAGRWRAEADAADTVTVFVVDAEGRYHFSRLTERHPTLSARRGLWQLTGDGVSESGGFATTEAGDLIVSLADRQVTWRRRGPGAAPAPPPAT